MLMNFDVDTAFQVLFKRPFYTLFMPEIQMHMAYFVLAFDHIIFDNIFKGRTLVKFLEADDQLRS